MSKKPNNGWASRKTAQKYDQYAQQFPLYKETNRDLVKLAKIKKGMTVVDLACGAGATTEVILKKVGDSGRIYSVDLSPSMLDVAKGKIKAKNVIFIRASAEELDKVVKEKVNRVVCNSAFWQMEMEKALRAIAKVLADEGRFIFNMPGQYFKLPRKQPPSLYPLSLEVAKDKYDFEPSNKPRQRPILDYESMKNILEANSFSISSHRIISYKRTIEQTIEFLKIPVMTERWFPGLDYERRMVILKEVEQKLDISREYLSHWIYFVTRMDKHPED